MFSPVKFEKELNEKYGITDKVDLSPVAKLSYLETQRNELQHVLWRAKTDMIHSKRLQESENETLQMKGNDNMIKHMNEVKQFVGAIEMLDEFINELKAEYKELQAEA